MKYQFRHLSLEYNIRPRCLKIFISSSVGTLWSALSNKKVSVLCTLTYSFHTRIYTYNTYNHTLNVSTPCRYKQISKTVQRHFAQQFAPRNVGYVVGMYPLMRNV